MKLSKESTKERKLAPEGQQSAILIAIVDYGTQRMEYNKEVSEKKQIKLVFELTDERAVFVEEKGPQPFVVSIKVNKTLYERSNLYKLLSSWTKSNLDNELDLTELMLKPAELIIKHKESLKGNKYAYISDILPAKKNKTYGKAESDGIILDLYGNESSINKKAASRQEAFDSIYDYMKEDIKSAVDFHEFGIDYNVDTDNTMPNKKVDEDLF